MARATIPSLKSLHVWDCTRKEMLFAERAVCEILPCTGDSSPGSGQLKLLAENFTVMCGMMM